MTEDTVTLKVGELTSRDEFGRGIVRIDTKTMQQLGIKEGDAVELQGQRKTGALAVRAYPADVGLSIIRMDGLTRRNAGIGVGESLKINKAKISDAKSVLLAPIQKGVIIQMNPDLLRRNLYMRPVHKKDIITPFPVVKQRRGSPFEELFGQNVFDDLFGFTPIPGETKLIVAGTNPEGIVRITESTQLQISPEAVEMEDRAIPTITYEDIGGLQSEIEKIREMVELPLRHPELFTRLGIEPPKGVLLYGPPGTGKTLLAKAVANESGAHFISVSGPEFISKWYGESLPGDEHVLVMEHGQVKHIPIKTLVEERRDAKVVSFDKNGKVKFSKIKDYIKHPRTGKILEVRTKTGRTIRVTDYHSLFTLNEGKVASIKTSEIVPGETYIAIPGKIPLPQIGQTSYNLLEMLKETNLLVKGCSSLVRKAVKKIGRQESARLLGTREKYVYDLYGKNVGIPIRKFLALMEKAGIHYSPKGLRIAAKFDRGSIPAVIHLTPGMMRLFGLWIAEGDINRWNLRISSASQEYKEDIRRTCRQLGLAARIYPDNVRIGSKPLAVWLESLGFNRYATKKRIPGMIFTLPEALIQEFLKGYFSGDGSVYPNQRGILTVEATTHSRGLANDLMHLLLAFGIVASVYKDKSKVRHRVCFRGAGNIEIFKKICFMDMKRASLLRKYCSRIKWKRSDQIPLSTSLKKLLREQNKYPEWAHCETIGREKLIGLLNALDPEKHKYKELWMLADNQIYWDRVEEVSEVPGDSYVYDVSVNPTENFLAGFGGIFAHNSERNLRKIFKEAEKDAPSIIFIDEIDAIAPKREEVTGEVERRIVSQMLTLMDGLKSRGKVIVIAATNRENAIDPALRRGGRFDREIEIGVPDQKGRNQILQIHTRNMPLEKDVDLNQLSSITYGFVGADLEMLCKEAAMSSLRRALPGISWRKTKELPPDIFEKLKVKKLDFTNALKLVEPSAMREVMIEIPNIKWSDVGGLEEVKQQLKEVIKWPLTHPEAFKRLGIRPPAGVLLYGPPGTGKTLLAKAVANESQANFISIRGPEVLSKWVGESEKRIRDIFRRAKQVAPAIIFFDEIDAIAPRRGQESGTRVMENVVSMILTEMSGLEELHNVIVVAATNRPDIVDPALLRPGRFDRQILVPQPDLQAREEILKIHTKDMPLTKEIDIEDLAKRTEGFSGADLEALVREAGLFALRESMSTKIVAKKHFEKAFSMVRPSITKDMSDFYLRQAESMKVVVKEEKEVGYVG